MELGYGDRVEVVEEFLRVNPKELQAIRDVLDQREKDLKRKGPFNSTHEGYAIMLEELDELWDEVKKNRQWASAEEAVQLASAALVYLIQFRR